MNIEERDYYLRHNDSQEQIQKCLKCNKTECSNCLGLINKQENKNLNRAPGYNTRVIQIDAKTGEEIAKFDNTTEAANVLGIPKSNIYSVLRGRTKATSGFCFKYGECKPVTEKTRKYGAKRNAKSRERYRLEKMKKEAKNT